MTDIKTMVDRELVSLEYTRNADELFSKYDKRHTKIRKTALSFSAFCFVIAAFVVSGSLFPTKNLNAKAFALEIGGSCFSEEAVLLSDSKGVCLIGKRVYYDSIGREIIDGRKSDKSFTRLVVSPSPLTVEITGEDIRSFTVSCSSNGSLYNAKGEDVCGKRLNATQSVSWQPNCNKLIKALGNGKVPSTLKDDRRSTEKLKNLLVTAEDYNCYFGDTISVKVVHDTDEVESLTAKIMLDERGRYYISKSE